MISSGHREADIPFYTLAKISLFINEIESAENIQLAHDIHTTALGAQGSNGSIKKRIEELVKKNG